MVYDRLDMTKALQANTADRREARGRDSVHTGLVALEQAAARGVQEQQQQLATQGQEERQVPRRSFGQAWSKRQRGRRFGRRRREGTTKRRVGDHDDDERRCREARNQLSDREEQGPHAQAQQDVPQPACAQSRQGAQGARQAQVDGARREAAGETLRRRVDRHSLARRPRRQDQIIATKTK